VTSQAHALQQLALARDRDPVFNFSFERSDEPVAFTGLIEVVMQQEALGMVETKGLVSAIETPEKKIYKKKKGGEIFENLHDFPISG